VNLDIKKFLIVLQINDDGSVEKINDLVTRAVEEFVKHAEVKE